MTSKILNVFTNVSEKDTASIFRVEFKCENEGEMLGTNYKTIRRHNPHDNNIHDQIMFPQRKPMK
jgi:hypothetical protein